MVHVEEMVVVESIGTDEKGSAVPLELQEDDFKPSPMRFLVAALLCVSSALSGYILTTYITIW